jgi:NAD+ kinase
MDAICIVSKGEIPKEFYDNFNIVNACDKEWYQCCVALGGDGTVLDAFHAMQLTTPIAGLNKGHLGFLTSSVDTDMFIQALKHNKYNTVKRDTISLTIDGTFYGRALNEVVIYNAAQGNLTDIIVEVGDDRSLIRYHCDALIVSTPTGSTAYNLSAGGSIIDPSIEAVCLTPVAPFSMSSRPVIINNTGIRITCNHTATCICDGKVANENVAKGCDISITNGGTMETIYIGNSDFLKVIQDKLGWNRSLKFGT